MSTRSFVVLIVLLSAVLGVSVYAGFSLMQGRGGGSVQVGGPFSLTDQSGRRVTEKDFAGKVLLVNFGYTFCPDVCPTELAAMTAAIDQLGDAAKRVQPLFITIDPTRDTVAQLALYHQNFHPSFAMLTGSEDEIARAARAYRVYYKKADSQSATEYLMDHSALVYLMGPDGRFLTHFTPQTTPELMAAEILKQLG
jgi:cytochrome oxidase Cu insertion factor (SCO1/SenC/PrrC family)